MVHARGADPRGCGGRLGFRARSPSTSSLQPLVAIPRPQRHRNLARRGLVNPPKPAGARAPSAGRGGRRPRGSPARGARRRPRRGRCVTAGSVPSTRAAGRTTTRGSSCRRSPTATSRPAATPRASCRSESGSARGGAVWRRRSRPWPRRSWSVPTVRPGAARAGAGVRPGGGARASAPRPRSCRRGR